MKSKKATQRALLSSLLSLLLCCSMLLGTTFAWFTDSVTSSGNIIKSGTLDVELWFGETQDTMVNIEEATEKAIFNYQYWEPGYVDLEYIQLKNVGDLAFKYQMRIVPENAVADGMKLAEVIDVYATVVGDNFTAPERDTVENLTKLGTLKDLMANPNGVDDGVLLPREGEGSDDVVTPTVEYYTGEVTVCLALKMQEEAGNEYQNLSIGDGFDIQVLATQYTYENDSFDHLYDEWANGDSLTADVTPLGTKVVNATMGIGGTVHEIELDPTFQFQPTESYEEAQKSPYRYYHADFVVSADKDVAAESMYLAGYYDAWCQYNNDNWVAMFSTDDIPANTEIRLVEALGATVNYEELCLYGNDGIGFLCGASDQDFANVGTTLTVELRLYETTGDPSTPDGPKNIETGEYMTIATYKHTFQKKIDTADKLQDALAQGGEVALTADIRLEDDPIVIAAGTQATIDLNGHTLSGVATNAAASNLIKVPVGAELTLKNGTVSFAATTPDTNWGGAGQPAFPGYANNTINNSGKLIIDGATIENLTAAGGASYAIDCYAGSDLVINNGTIKGYDKVAIRMFANSATENTKVTINGGEISGRRGIWIQLPSNDASKAMMAELNVNGGTVTALDEEDCAIYSYSYGNSFAETYVNITGGTFNGDVCFGGGDKATVENVNITGGTFNGELGRYLANDDWADIAKP